MTQGGGGGFETGADYVAAKVSIDVPSEGIQSLKEISQGIDRFRTATEAAARGSASFIGYLNQMVQAGNMATEANRNLAAQLERTADTQQRMQTGGSGGAQQLAMSRGAPQGFVDNFAGMGIGMGGQRAPTTPAVGEMQQQIDATQGSAPRKYLSAQAGRNRLVPGELAGEPPGSVDWGSHADRVEQRDRAQRNQAAETGGMSPGGGGGDWPNQVSKYGGLAGNMMNEMAPGKGFGGIAGMAGAGLSALGRRASAAAPSGSGAAEESAEKATSAQSSKGGGILGMLAPLLKFAGPVGAAVGAGVGALGLVEKGGSMIQGYRNMGNIQGGGSSQGFADDMRIKAMALDPFLSTEQARSVVMAGLTEGYHGAQFDTVTKFIASNLKDMNLSVADSVGLLRKNVAEGGESLGDLRKQLQGMKDMAKGSTMSLPDIQANVAQTSDALISAGGPGKASTEAAMGVQGMGSTEATRALKGAGGQLLGSLANSSTGGAAMAAFGGVKVPGLMPNEYTTFLLQHGGATALKDAFDKTMIKMVRTYFHGPSAVPNSAAKDNMLGIFTNNILPTFFKGETLDQGQVEIMVDNILDGNDPLAPGKKIPSGDAGGGGGPAGPTPPVVPDAGMSGSFHTSAGVTPANAGPAPAGVVGNIANQYGNKGVQVVDSKGNASPYTASKAQQAGLGDGALKWRRSNEQGGGLNMAQTAGGGGGGDTEHRVTFSPAQVNIRVDSTGKATASPNVVQLSPNAQAVNSGVGSAGMNNPPPGDGYGYNYTGTQARE